MRARVAVFLGMAILVLLNAPLGLARASEDWHEAIAIAPRDVPLPPSAPAGATIHGVYSPAVCRTATGYYMFFGVSIHFNIHHDVYRDSIAYAHSPDGITNWKFIDYILEPFPDKSIQHKHRDTWPTGTLYQVNDPSVLIQDDRLFIAYTSVKWKYPFIHRGNGPSEIGCIGLATFRIQPPFRLTMIDRNDTWLEPTRTSPISTCSRPEFLLQEDGSLTLWFDSSGTLCSIPNSQLSSSLKIDRATSTNLSGAVDVFILQKGTKYLALANNPRFIPISESADGKKWSAWHEFYRPQASWARGGAGSPCLLADAASGTQRLYFGGIVMKNAHEYDAITIGVAYRQEVEASRRPDQP